MTDAGSYLCAVVGQEQRYFAIATLDVQSCECPHHCNIHLQNKFFLEMAILGPCRVLELGWGYMHIYLDIYVMP